MLFAKLIMGFAFLEKEQFTNKAAMQSELHYISNGLSR